MKKILLGAISLLCFSFALIVFQLSCKKSANATPPTNSTSSSSQLGKIVYEKQFYGSGGIGFDRGEIWTANYDGSSQQKISITLPTNVVIALVEPKVSPDGKTIFFNAFLTNGTQDESNGWDLYACDIDGSNVRKIVSANGNSVTIGQAF